MRGRRPIGILGFILVLPASLSLACNSGGSASTEGAGQGAAAAGADRVLVATLAPEPTRTLETVTPTQAPAATLFVHTPLPPTTTPTPRPTLTPSPTFTPSPTATPSPTPTPIVIGGIVLTPREQAIFAAHNEERVLRSIAPLILDPTLMAIARERARVMADNHLFSHYNLNGDTVYDMFADAGYDWLDATENIHFNDVSPSQAESWAMTEYMKSPPHRANILKPGFHRIGVGVATSSAGVHYYSVVFSD